MNCTDEFVENFGLVDDKEGTTPLTPVAVTFCNESLKIVKVFPLCTAIFGRDVVVGSVDLSPGDKRKKLDLRPRSRTKAAMVVAL